MPRERESPNVELHHPDRAASSPGRGRGAWTRVWHIHVPPRRHRADLHAAERRGRQALGGNVAKAGGGHFRALQDRRRSHPAYRSGDGRRSSPGRRIGMVTTASTKAASEFEATTIRRVTLRLLPFLMVCYFVSFVDRVNLGFAALQMVRDLQLSATVFGLGGGVFFLSYFLFEVPSNLVLARVGARLWIARIMISWGVLAIAMALVTGPRSLYAMRFLLGAAEAGFFPGVMLYLTYWFPSEYRARIIALFTVAIPVSGFLGSPISAALLGLDGWLGIRGWQWMFIIEGIPAVLLGLACLFVLTDRPAHARWLSADQRHWLQHRLARDGQRHVRLGHANLWQVLWNRDVLILSLVLAGSTAVSSGLQLWQPQIIQSYGLTNMQTGLLNSIPFALAAVVMILWGRRSDLTGERIWHSALPLILTAVSLAGALVFDS